MTRMSAEKKEDKGSGLIKLEIQMEEEMSINGSKNDDIGENPNGFDWPDMLYGNDDMPAFNVSSAFPMRPQNVTVDRYHPFKPLPLWIRPGLGKNCKEKLDCSQY